MSVEYVDFIDSTQQELARRVKDSASKNPLKNLNNLKKNRQCGGNGSDGDMCVVADYQTSGIGSRSNAWQSPNEALLFSFTYSKPVDSIPNQSLAIYFGYLFKLVLGGLGSKAWLKYPNDLFVGEKKIGGVLVSIVCGRVICGIGLNIKSEIFGTLDINADREQILEKYFNILKNPPKWKQVFSKYKLEFPNNFPFTFHIGERIISLNNAVLLEDGAVEIDGKRFYNLREGVKNE